MFQEKRKSREARHRTFNGYLMRFRYSFGPMDYPEKSYLLHLLSAQDRQWRRIWSEKWIRDINKEKFREEVSNSMRSATTYPANADISCIFRSTQAQFVFSTAVSVLISKSRRQLYSGRPSSFSSISLFDCIFLSRLDVIHGFLYISSIIHIQKPSSAFASLSSSPALIPGISGFAWPSHHLDIAMMNLCLRNMPMHQTKAEPGESDESDEFQALPSNDHPTIIQRLIRSSELNL
jgi:hypothetical protein